MHAGIAERLARGKVSGLDLHRGQGCLGLGHRHLGHWMLENLRQQPPQASRHKDPPRLAHLQQRQVGQFLGGLALGQHQGQMAVLVQGALLGAKEHGHVAVAGIRAGLDGFAWPAPGQTTRFDCA